MGKRYKGKVCAYCAIPGSSTTADHVFAREFFTSGDRSDLAKVPACERCNNEKSKLEHYLASVLPFGGRHPDASKMLGEYVPPRLEKNKNLQKQLAAGRRYEWHDDGSGLIAPRMGIPFESEKLAELFIYVAKGLSVHHWGYVVPAETTIRSGMITSLGASYFEQMLALNGKRVRSSLGNEVFVYDGLQSTSEPQISIWKFTPFGGVQMSGDPNFPQETPTDVWVTTNPARISSPFD